MSAIWHDTRAPSWLGAGPQFSFQDIAEIVQPAPESYAHALDQMRRWERKMGSAWFAHNAELAHRHWGMKRPWWLT